MHMSAYSIDTGEHRVTFGWDSEIRSLFFAVYSLERLREREQLEGLLMAEQGSGAWSDAAIDRLAEMDDDCQPICRRGTTFYEIQTVQRLRDLIGRYVDLPRDMEVKLLCDMGKLEPRSSWRNLWMHIWRGILSYATRRGHP
jgi:hypothetical protein